MSTPHHRILLIAAGSARRHPLVSRLTGAGHRVRLVNSGREALRAARSAPPTLFIYDAASLRWSGVRTCARLRAAHPDIPLLYCHSAEQEVTPPATMTLRYPFTTRVLIGRLRRLLPLEDDSADLQVGPLTLYREQRTIRIDGRGEFPLTPKLVDLLAELMRHPNELVTRRHLMAAVWQTEFIEDTRTLDVHIRWARQVLEAEPGRPHLLRTVRGKGYLLFVAEAGEGEGR